MAGYSKTNPASVKQNARFSDISIGFGFNPFSKDVTRITDVDAVKRSIKSLVMTNKYERLLDPDIGGNVTGMLFEPMTALSESILQNYITEVIENYEPRARLEYVQVQANPDNYSLNVTIRFKVDTSETSQVLEFLLDRVR